MESGMAVGNSLELALEDEFDEALFPILCTWLKNDQEVLELVQRLNRTKILYGSTLDLVLGTLMPAFRPHLRRYYEKDGPRISFYCDEAAIGRIERMLLDTLHQFRGLLYGLQAHGWEEGAPMSAAVRKAVQKITAPTISWKAPPLSPRKRAPR